MWPFIIAGAGVLLIRELLKESGWNRHCKKKDIDSLPESPGVYIFYKGEYIIHIGHTGNLYQRIYGHSKKHEMKTFDWKETETIDDAYELELKLQDKYEYPGR